MQILKLSFCHLVRQLLGAFLLVSVAVSAETIRVGAQMTGSLNWELTYIKERGLDKAAGLEIVIVPMATTEAGKIALSGGAVDIILSDWLWVARERSLGVKLTFTPYSSALGAVMVPAESPIRSLADLGGKSVGVAGGPLDKSWLLLRALAQREGLDLAAKARPAYAAPPLINQKVIAGELDAAVQFWNFCVPLQARGFRALVEIEAVEKSLGAKGAVGIVGFVFKEEFATSRTELLARFLDLSRTSRKALAQDSAAWAAVMERLQVSDPAMREIYRSRYSAGQTHRPLDEEEADARILFSALATTGGTDLVGNAKTLDAGVFYRPGKR